MLLYPDPRVSYQPDNLTTCFAAPIEPCDWEHLWAIAKGSGKDFSADSLNGMPYVILADDIYFMRSRGEDGYDTLIVLLREDEDADTCLESAAWIRVKHEYNGMIYICHKQSASANKDWQEYVAITAEGVDETLVAMVDLINEAEYSEEDQP